MTSIEDLGNPDLPLGSISQILSDNFPSVLTLIRGENEESKSRLIRACQLLGSNATFELARAMQILDPFTLRFTGECEYLFFMAYLQENKSELELALEKSIGAFAYETFGFRFNGIHNWRYDSDGIPYLDPYSTKNGKAPEIHWEKVAFQVASLATYIQQNIPGVPLYAPYFSSKV